MKRKHYIQLSKDQEKLLTMFSMIVVTDLDETYYHIPFAFRKVEGGLYDMMEALDAPKSVQEMIKDN